MDFQRQILRIRIRKLAFLLLIFTCAAAFYAVLEFSFLGPGGVHYYTKVPFHFKTGLVVFSIVGFVMGMVMGLLDIFIVDTRIQKGSFAWKVFIKTLIYVSTLMLIVSVSSFIYYSQASGQPLFDRSVLESVRKLFKTPTFWVLATYISAVIGAVNFVNQQKISLLEKEKEADVMGRIVEALRDDRQRLAQEIHSGLCSNLTALRNEFSSIYRDTDALSPEANHRVSKAIRLLGEAGKDASRYAHALTPFTLEKLGLVEAIREEANRIQNSGGPVFNILVESAPETIPPKTERQLFFILKELILNTLKHGKASSIKIRFGKEADDLLISYQDNGSGFDPQKALKTGGIGLVGMMVQAKQVNGTLVIESKAGKGMKAILKAPFQYAKV
jgi:signal transduction histidine kinase